MDIKEFVSKDNLCYFYFYRSGFFYFNVKKNNSTEWYQFFVPIEDIGNATIEKEAKAITFMRWIRKSIEDKTLTKISS